MPSATERSPWYLSFGFKLTLVMTLVAVLVSGSALWVLQQQFREAYLELTDAQFRQQSRLFAERREARLQGVKAAVGRIAREVRTIAAIHSGDNERLYADVDEELRTAFLQEGSTRQIFVRFLDDVSGQWILPPEGLGGRMPASARQVWPEKLRGIVDAQPQDLHARPRAAYLSFGDGPEKTLFEVVPFPIVDAFDGYYLGHLLVCQELLAEEVRSDSEQMHTALWGDGFLLGDGILSQGHNMGSLLKEAQTRPVKARIGLIPYRLMTEPVAGLPGYPEARQVVLFSLAPLEARQRQLQATLVLATSLACLAGLILSIVLSSRLSQPILELVKGTRAVAQGDLTVQVRERGHDEIGRLTRSFNHMTTELAQKERIKNVLDRVTDPRVADQLLKGQIGLGGESRTVTMLFCDIRGFTSLTDGMDPQEVVRVVNTHMTLMTAIAHECGGVVDKFVGDEIIVLFGAPAHYGDDAWRAVRCGLEMVRRRRRANEGNAQPIRIGVGIATGKVVAGCMGSEDRLNYTVLGDRVNLAARLCSRAGPMEVLIDETTRAQLPEETAVSRLDGVPLKGFATAQPVYLIEHLPALQPPLA